MEKMEKAKVHVFGKVLEMKDWALDRFGCFNKRNEKGNQVRLNFRDPVDLKLEKKVLLMKAEKIALLAKAEKEKHPQSLKNSKWIIDKSGSYDKVKVVDGEIIFEQEIKITDKSRKGE